MRTQVAIIGAGPAGLILGRLLRSFGVSSVILEARDRRYVEQRVRAGLLEPGTVDVLASVGVADRLRREGMPQAGFDLRFAGASHHVPVAELCGRGMTVYGQSEVVKDLIEARLADGDPLLFEVGDVELHGIEGSEPSVTFVHDGASHRLDCDFVAGCDGFHGVCRRSLPAAVRRVYEHIHPFSWLGILVEAPPSSGELIYTHHEDGFALQALRTPELTRLYVQCAADADLGEWPDERVWDALRRRLATTDGFRLREGRVLEKGITRMRSFVVEPMQHGRMFLAGDAAHIVPPTGAKGLNLAVADVRVLGAAFETHFRTGDEAALRAYSDTCLRRVWRTQRFSSLMTSMLHRMPGDDDFQRQLQVAELQHVIDSPATARALVESYTGTYPA